MIRLLHWFTKQRTDEQLKPAQERTSLPPSGTHQPEPAPRTNLPPLDSALRLSDWRLNNGLVAQMRSFLGTQFGRDVMSTLVNECRVQQGMPTPTEQVIGLELGRIAGHQEVIDIMLLMAEPIERPAEIPITYPENPAFPREQ